MRLVLLLIITALSGKSFANSIDSLPWIKKEFKSYSLNYTSADQPIIETLVAYINKAILEAPAFFNLDYKENPRIYIFPNRQSLTKQWRLDWKLPDFNAECWMVASGVARRLDMLSPGKWNTEACDHPGDSTEIKQIILHELVHTLHAQNNPRRGFEGMEELDWLVEGMATYASGQLNSRRIQRIMESINAGNQVTTFKELWKGQDKYGKAGSFVAFLDKNYGRKALTNLLSVTDQQAVLNALGITEAELLRNWTKSLSVGQ